MTRRALGERLAARVGAGACRGVAAVAGVFTLAVFLLLVASHAQTRRADPLESKALAALHEELRRQPERPGLREEYRRLDLLARRAYFDAVAFRRTGAWLLLAGAVVLVAALTCGATLVPPPRRVPGAAPAPESVAAAHWLVGAVGVVIAGTLVFLALRFRPPPAPPAAAGAPSPGAVAGSPALPPVAAAPEAATGADAEGKRRWEERIRQWPAFRGADGSAHAGGDAYPTDWDGATGRAIRWRTPLPLPGFGSPVVWGNRVFVAGADEAARELWCLDAGDGRLLWRHAVAGIAGAPAAPPVVTPDTGYAAASPATDGRRVFAVFANGDLVAVDFEGTRLWGVNLGASDNPYGHASSPLVWRDLLIVQYDQRLQARVLALDAATGAVVWERFRESEVTWSSPIIVARDGREELVLNGNPAVAGYDPATGDELWSLPVLAGEVASSPAQGEGLVFTANAGGRLAAIAPAGGARIVWEHGADLPEVSSPLAANGLVFIADGAGALTCLDARTGRVLWRREFDTGFYASPVLAGGLVYLLDREGTTRVFEPAPEYRERAAPVLGVPSGVTPAFAAGRIFFRAEREIVCVGRGGPPGATEVAR